MTETKYAPESTVVCEGRDGRVGAPLNRPIVPASNFIIGGEREYSRGEGTPTWEALEEVVAALEGGPTVSFASGMAAIAAVFELMPVGAQIVLPEDCYQGVGELARRGESQGRWSVERLASDDTEAWVNACSKADLLWLESPTNPLLVVADVRRICSVPRKAGSVLAVDNTFATSLNQQPLKLGADLSIHSATKFIGGHSDLLAGTVSARDEAISQQLRATRAVGGATPGALESFLAVRGIRTMAVRLERAQATAMILAQRLLEHPRVAKVRYPGLPSHPTHAVARDQLRGFGTIISFDLVGDASTADALCRRVKLIQHATSLGAVESTMERRAAIPGQEHLPETLLRLSVGIEHVEDLWRDLDEGLST